MKYMELIAPCHFGMEAVLKREILDLGYEISKVEDGKVTFLADAEGIAQANMFLRTTERILLKTGEFKAVTFDELFEKTKAIPWEEYIPKDGKFWVAKANSVKSALFSPSDIQSIMKKAIWHCPQRHTIRRADARWTCTPIFRVSSSTQQTLCILPAEKMVLSMERDPLTALRPSISRTQSTNRSLILLS